MMIRISKILKKKKKTNWEINQMKMNDKLTLINKVKRMIQIYWKMIKMMIQTLMTMNMINLRINLSYLILRVIEEVKLKVKEVKIQMNMKLIFNLEIKVINFKKVKLQVILEVKEVKTLMKMKMILHLEIKVTKIKVQMFQINL